MSDAQIFAPPIGAPTIRRLLLGAVWGFALTATTAHADVTVFDKDGLTFEAGLTAGAGVFHVGNANLGAGVAKPGGGIDRNRNWTEGFIAPSGKLTYSTEAAGAFYGGARIVGAGTAGDGDAGGIAQGRQGRFTLDHLYAGWRSGTLFSALGENAIDISAGRQPFNIGDGFLINDGNADGPKEGAYWLAPRNGWGPSSVVARVDVKPFHADVFRLKSDSNSSSDVIYGTNLEWHSGPDGKNVVGGSLLKVSDSKLPTRDGMRVYSLRAQGAFIPGVPDLFLAGEFTKERNSRSVAEVDANAWYGEANYTLSQVGWTPKFGYRYSHFSGDKPGTAASEAFDPLHYGAGIRGWGTWFQGEIAGQYFFPIMNTNVNVHQLQASIQPLDTVTLTALYYIFDFDRKPVGIASDRVGKEVNFVVDWQATENLSVSGGVGQFNADSGGKQLLGGTKNSTVAEIFLLARF
ncbi:alginate export family protein [Azospirillum sp. Sh1]|uniref:alginate export family protein n=1 Tax=Azospirillum sp. Sh1 TaxID=2607285 RepID=UPI00165DE064|nr:alginate export family protein [Azospirillum sp. Sh1]